MPKRPKADHPTLFELDKVVLDLGQQAEICGISKS
jgi:hypothetical protein